MRVGRDEQADRRTVPSGHERPDLSDQQGVAVDDEQIVIAEADLQSAGYTDIDDNVDVVVYQISAVVGRGYGTSATV